MCSINRIINGQRTSNAGKLYSAINRGFINKKEVNKKTKIALYKAIYIPTLTYSCYHGPYWIHIGVKYRP
jgi:hypothetical protein